MKSKAVRRETVRIGKDDELGLRIGYLRCYSGQELHQAVAEFTQLYPEVEISIVNGTMKSFTTCSVRRCGPDPE